MRAGRAQVLTRVRLKRHDGSLARLRGEFRNDLRLKVFPVDHDGSRGGGEVRRGSAYKIRLTRKDDAVHAALALGLHLRRQLLVVHQFRIMNRFYSH